MAAGTRERTTVASLNAAGRAELAQTDAALVLGTASRALDYDDVCMLATCHPGAPVFAALLALLPQLESRRATLGDPFTRDQLRAKRRDCAAHAGLDAPMR